MVLLLFSIEFIITILMK